jgi:hypothetical protein
MRQAAITSWREEKKSGASLGEDYLYWFEFCESLEEATKDSIYLQIIGDSSK